MHYERPTFAEIKGAIRRTFPMPDGPELWLSPDSLDKYFAAGGIDLPWERVPNWEENNYGRRGFTNQEFMSVLFSPLAPRAEESIYAIPDECVWEGKQLGFELAFKDLLQFAEQVYPAITPRRMAFFQPSDAIFFAEASRL